MSLPPAPLATISLFSIAMCLEMGNSFTCPPLTLGFQRLSLCTWRIVPDASPPRAFYLLRFHSLYQRLPPWHLRWSPLLQRLLWTLRTKESICHSPGAHPQVPVTSVTSFVQRRDKCAAAMTSTLAVERLHSQIRHRVHHQRKVWSSCPRIVPVKWD